MSHTVSHRRNPSGATVASGSRWEETVGMERPAQVDVVRGDTVRVVLAGMVLLVRHDEVLSQVERAMKAGHCTEVQVDLAEVTALDSSGVALLLLTRRLALRAGARFR